MTDYVGSEACLACHQEAAESWSGSHHALAWTRPSPETVMADFNGTVFSHDGMTSRFHVVNGIYQVEVTEKDGAKSQYRIHSVAGIEPLQQYLLETELGRLQSFDVVWDIEQRNWFHLYPEQDLTPDDALHWTGPYKNWNARCAECHATGFEKNYDLETRRYASTQVEIGVGCEACHGPGAAHLAWAEDTTRDPPEHYGFSQPFATTESTIQQCATCHSRREAYDDASPLPGTPFHDAYGLALLQPGLYHADGQILEEVYVYGSFLQSKMYTAGVSCLDCHDAHTGEAVAQGNAVCTQCHSPAGNPRFETLAAGLYDAPAHHFHEPGSAAAQCTACHAPERVYMGNDWRADHSFRVPRPDLWKETGAPDVCSACHTDRSAEWAAAEIAERFPDSRHRGPHFGQVLAAGRADAGAARAELKALAEDAAQPGIVRATALWLLEGVGDSADTERLAPLLNDRDPLVRAAAARLLRIAPDTIRVARLLDAVADPVRSVRIAAARAIVGAPIVHLPHDQQALVDRAMNEWRAAMASQVDFPETHLQLAGVALTLRALPQAEAAFRETLRLDPQRVEAWLMLVRLAAATQGVEAALKVLDQAFSALPGEQTLINLREELKSAEAND